MCEPEKKRQRVEEIWETVVGHDNFRVSSKGRIVNKNTGRQATAKYGQLYGKLFVILNKKKVEVCPLVAEVFSITPARDDQTILYHTGQDEMNVDVRSLKYVSLDELAAIFSSVMDETWRPIAGYDRYFLSSKGRIMNHSTRAIMVQKRGRSSANIALFQGVKQKMLTVYLLMVSVFSITPGSEDQTIVHHRDFDLMNNAVDNLCFVSEEELASINMQRSHLKWLPGEIWTPVVGYPKYYVSSFGRVYNTLLMNMLEQNEKVKGYKSVSVSHGYNTEHTTRKAKRVFTHRLVAFAFLGNPCENETVDHINTIRSDNTVGNLRWASPHIQRLNRQASDNTRTSPNIISSCLDTGVEMIFFKAKEAAIVLKEMWGTKHVITTIQQNIYKAIHGNFSYINRAWQYDVLNPTGEIRESPSHPGHLISSCGMFKRPGGYWTFGSKCEVGYMHVEINRVQKRVHRLVLEAFRTQDPTPEQNLVNHISGKKHENALSNLEYVSHAENMQHAYRTNLNNGQKMVIGTCIESGKSTKYISMSSAARETKCSVSGISECCRGRLKKTGGHMWQYG